MFLRLIITSNQTVKACKFALKLLQMLAKIILIPMAEH